MISCCNALSNHTCGTESALQQLIIDRPRHHGQDRMPQD
jgi:hypothetical protein